MNDGVVPNPLPGDNLEEHERQTTIRQIQQAMADGHVDFDELDDRFARVYQAETKADLMAVVADLPQPPGPAVHHVGHPLPESGFALFGDVTVGGWVSVGTRLTFGAVFGDIVIDLSSADLPEEVTISTYSMFGDTVVIVPDGTRANMQSFLLFGDRKIDLSPARLNAPTVRVTSAKLFGDCKLYSLSLVPEGRFRKLWRSLRGKS